tara:strand:- start:15749 stop:15922 length:174 start_codon:yes stop_codon:yes gene_type:complete
VTDKKEPPVALVRTWINLLTSSEEKEVKDRASEMLLNAFGSMKNAAEFAEKHQIHIP